MLNIRASRHGSKKKPFYRIIVIDKRKPRNGMPVEQIGFFDPITKKTYINLKKLRFWIKTGAQMSKRIKFLSKKYKKI